MDDNILIISLLIVLTCVAITVVYWLYRCFKWLRVSTHVELEYGATVKEISVRFIAHRWTIRELSLFLIVLIPVILFSDFSGFPSIAVICIASVAYLMWIVSKPIKTGSTDVDKLTKDLSKMLSTINESAIHVETLVSTIRSRETEAQQKTDHLKNIRKEIAITKEEAKAFDELSEEQKEMFLNATKEAQKVGGPKLILTMIFAVLFNIIATFIWTLMGNPGRDQIIKIVKELFG